MKLKTTSTSKHTPDHRQSNLGSSLLLGCAFTLATMVSATAANILTNPGFELGSGSDADNWTEFQSPPHGTTTRSTLQPLTGTSHMYMQVDNLNNPPGGAALFAEQNQTVGSIDNSLNYNLSLYARSDSMTFTGVDMFYQILWLDQDGSDGGGVKGESLVQLIPAGINTSYQQFSLNNIDVPDGTDSFLLRFQLSAGAIPGIQQGLSVDDVSLEAIPEPSASALLGLGAFALLRRRRA